MILGPFDEYFGLMQRSADEIGCYRRKHAKRKHAAPANHRQQQRRGNSRDQHAGLPAQANIRRGTGAFRCRPCFGDQRHADTEFTAKPDARKRSVDQEIPVTLRKRTKTGEHREHDDGPGQDTHATEAIGQHAEADAAKHGSDQRGRHQRRRLRLRKIKVACDRSQHGIAERGTRQRLPRVAVDGGRHALDAVSRNAHF
jgi:hypothetical protein